MPEKIDNKPEKNTRSTIKTAAMLFLLMACPYMTWAVESEKTGTLNFVLENDLFYNTDQHYTNGVRLIWVPGHDVSAPDWAVSLTRLVPWLPEKGRILHG